MFDASKKKKNYPVLRNKHMLYPPGDASAQKKNTMVLLRAFEDFKEVKSYLETSMFIKLHDMIVTEPMSTKEPIVIVTEYEENGTREEYDGTTKVENNQQLVYEMTKFITQICDGKAGVVPKVEGMLLENPGCCKK
ncbi:Hypothetical_protein [Hexamita inflata]|uniref:Hypothetical_protein n=1 Tax=Hexamita inflata TaxID=28002 RepID=A0AA86NEB5_9EUKA|nr:Hypothetical protein HINF_LOCUS5166 [Hexamita inflata]